MFSDLDSRRLLVSLVRLKGLESVSLQLKLIVRIAVAVFLLFSYKITDENLLTHHDDPLHREKRLTEKVIIINGNTIINISK